MKKYLCLMLVVLLVFTSAAAEELARGSKGSAVVELQERLNSVGYNVGTADGDFGKKTENAILEFQRDHGLPETGILDNATRELLFSDEPDSDESDEASEQQGATIASERARQVDTGIHRYSFFVADQNSSVCGWEEANIRAIGMEGHLVSIDSMAEYMEIQSEILELGYTDVRFWIGAYFENLDFYWVGNKGLRYLNPIDFDTTLEEYNPWAIGEPTYRDAEDNFQYYVQMSFSDSELRWVWKNTTGEIEEGVKTGYIVEFDDAKPLAWRNETDDDALYSADHPNESWTRTTLNDYKLNILGLDGNSIIAEVSTPGECVVYCGIWNTNDVNYDNELVHLEKSFGDGYSGDLVRIDIPMEEYDLIPQNFQLEGVLYHYDYQNDESIDLIDWVSCDLYKEGNKIMESVLPPIVKKFTATPDSAYRVTPVLASAPKAMNSSNVIEIYDMNEDLVTTAGQGESIYIKPGDYLMRLKGNEAVEAPFSVSDAPMIVTIQDTPLLSVTGEVKDEDSGSALDGIEVKLEAQGRTYTAITNRYGAYVFNGIPGVEAELSVKTNNSFIEGVKRVIRIVDNTVLEPLIAKVLHPVVLYGYLHDGSADFMPAYEEFFKKADEGYYGRDPWMISHTMYFTVANCDEYIGNSQNNVNETYSEGTVFNIGPDETAIKVEWEYRLDDFCREFGLDYATIENTPVIVKGFVHEDRLKENNPHFNEWFEGWSDKNLVVESVQIAASADSKLVDTSENAIPNKRDLIIAASEKHIGEAYKAAGDGNGGFDCIGLVREAYKSIGIVLPRSSTGGGAQTWAEQGLVKDVTGSRDAPAPGDILCWYKNSVKSGQPDHAAIYTGPIKTDVISGVYNGYKTNAQGYLIDEYGSLIDCINALNPEKGVCYISSKNYRNGVNTSYTDIWRIP